MSSKRKREPEVVDPVRESISFTHEELLLLYKLLQADKGIRIILNLEVAGVESLMEQREMVSYAAKLKIKTAILKFQDAAAAAKRAAEVAVKKPV